MTISLIPTKRPGAMPQRQAALPLFIDVETIPTQKPGALEEFTANVTPPGNYKKQESIDKWLEENAATAGAEAHHKTALKPWQGEIYCVAFALGNGPVNVLTRGSEYHEPASEHQLLTAFWNHIRQHRISTWVAHNAEFDIRTLYARSVVHQTRPSVPFPPETAPWKGEVTCTMQLAAGLRGTVSLDTLCKALNIPTPKDAIDGSGVWTAVQTGEHDKVSNYCKQDVEALRAVHARLTFTN